jgi:glycosyltransferase involved in cell wall biosynthesis
MNRAAALLQDRCMNVKGPLCLDGRMLAAEATGVATYARTVRAALTAVGRAPLILDDATRGRFGVDPRAGRWRRWLTARRAGEVALVAEPGGVFAPDVFALAQARFARTGEVLRLRAPGPPGVMHWTYPMAAAIEGWCNLYTVHDVIPLTHPELVETDGAALRRRLAAVLPHAAGVLTVSEHSRAEIVRTLGLAPDRVVNAGLAIEPAPAVALPAGLRANGYFLFHGLNEPRKNLGRIVAAWRASGTATSLVIAGPDGGLPIDLAGAVRLPFLARPELMALVAGARALVFPSLAEGFGLPIAEAMALGTPVLTSAGGACEETAGGAALLVPPTDTAAIAAALRRLDTDAALRATLRAAGRRRADAAFGLEAFGRRLLAAYADFAGASLLQP